MKPIRKTGKSFPNSKRLTIAVSSLVLAVTIFVGAASADEHPFSPVALAPHAAKEFAKRGIKFKAPFPNSANRGRKFNPQGETVLPLTTASEQNLVVLFVRFTDSPPGGPADPISLSYFDEMLFGTIYNPPAYSNNAPTDRTLVNYYKEVSYGAVKVITLNMPSSLGWANVGHPYSYYCNQDNGFGAYPKNAQGLVIDAIKALDPVIDFSKYAVNGVIPNLFVVHTGSGAEWSGTLDLIWSHAWDLTEGTGLDGFMVDGVKVNSYAMMPEIGGDTTGVWGPPTGPYPPTVGVFAHEYGHVLGLPDLYDYGYESQGVGLCSLMAAGSWNGHTPEAIHAGNSPAHLDAWSKYRLGFVKPIEVTGPTAAVLPPVETSPVIYKMTVPGSGGREYFLLENRQRVGFDEGLWNFDATGNPEWLHGLAIYHVDDTVLTRNYWRCNEAENWKEFRSTGAQRAWNGESHYAVSLIQADGLWTLEKGWSLGFAGNLYPGLFGVTEFGNFTSPNSSSYYFYSGNAPRFGYSGVTVSSIEEIAGVIRAQLSYKPATPGAKR